MNLDTFEIYRGEKEIEAAKERGERIAEVPELVALASLEERLKFAKEFDESARKKKMMDVALNGN